MTYPAATREWKRSTTGEPVAKNVTQREPPAALNHIASNTYDALLLFAPPGTPTILTSVLSTAGAMFTLLDPTPPNLAVFAIQNNGSKNLNYWFSKQSAVPTTNYLVLTPGTYRAYATRPPAIYCAPTSGDTTASVSFEFWLLPTESPI